MSQVATRIKGASFSAACEHLEALGRDLMQPMDFRVIAETEAAKAFVSDKKNHPMRFRYRGTINDLFEKLKRRNVNGFAIYYVLNETDGKGTKLANFTRALAVPLDLDGAPLPKWRGGIRPHLIVETSPGKYQCIFNIEPTADLKTAKHIAQRLANAYGGDSSVCDAPRVLRLSGFAHQKGKPFLSRIIETNEFQPPYRLAQFDAILPKLPLPKPHHDRPPGAGKMDRASAELLLDDLDPAELVPTNQKWVPFAMGAKEACADHDAEDYVLSWFARDGAHDADSAEHRFDSFTVGREAGVTVGTFIKVLMDHGVSASKVQTVFSDRVDAAEDFDYGEDDDDDSWLEGGPARMPKAKTHRTKGGVGYQFASDIHPEEIKWLWPNRIARGKLSFLAGPADQGKSQMICDITARVTNGQAWPNNEGKIAEADRGSVIVLSSEDDPADTMVPRLMAAGADLTRVIFVKMMVTPIEGKAGRMFNIAQDLAQLTEIIRARDDVKLITIDPINAYMGTGRRNGTDTFKTSEVRAVLSPLGDLSARHDVATLFLSHLTKGNSNGSPLGRMLDSQAFTAIARTGWFVAPEMKDKAETGLKFFVKGKSNVGAPMPGLTYRIEAVTVQTGNGLTLTVPRIKWEGTTDKSSAQAFRQMDNGGETEERGTLSDAAETFLRDELSPKPLDLKILRGRAEDAGHSWRNVRRVAAEIGVVSASDGFGKGRVTTWTLAEETDYL